MGDDFEFHIQPISGKGIKAQTIFIKNAYI